MTTDAKARRLGTDGTWDYVPDLLDTLGGASVDTTNDFVLMYDDSADGFAKVAAADLLLAAGVTATAAELIRATDVSTRLVTIVATGAITAALHEGKTCLLADVGGDTAVALTLPAATGSGGRYRFVVNVVNTAGYVIKAVTGADVMAGAIIGNDGGGVTTTLRWQAAATDDTITLNGTTMGGVTKGDWVELEDIATDCWAVRGVINQSGSEVTPFSDTVA